MYTLRQFLSGSKSNQHQSVASFWKREDGVFAVLTALIIGLLALLTALVIDLGFAYSNRNHLQATADASALAGAAILNEDDATVRSASDRYAELNMPDTRYGDVLSQGDIEIGNWDDDARTFTAGGTPRNAVRVTTRRTQATGNPVNTFFASFAGIDAFDVASSAVAVNGVDQDRLACLHALNPAQSEAFHIHGTADIRAIGCDIQVDSCAAGDALRANGNPSVVLVDSMEPGSSYVGQVRVCGGYSESGPVTIPEPLTGEEPLGDPFDHLNRPTPAERTQSCSPGKSNFKTSGDAFLTPGVYCGGVDLKGNGTVQFAPGTYYIRDGAFNVGGNIGVSGNEVTFVLLGSDANINFSGTADVALSAPQTGDYGGFVFFGDAANPATDPHVLRGTPLGGINGITYLPEADLEFKGTADGVLPPGNDDCSVVVADTLYFNGTVGLELDAECSQFSNAPAFNGGTMVLRLVN